MFHCASSLEYVPGQRHYGESVCLQDKKEELRVEQVQSEEKLTELETLLSTNLLKQQRELQERLSKADVSADRWHTHLLGTEGVTCIKCCMQVCIPMACAHSNSRTRWQDDVNEGLSIWHSTV